MLLAACGGNSSAAKGEGRTSQAQEAPLPVTVVPVRTQAVQRTIDFVGTLHANEEVAIASEVEGRIAAVEVDLGDRVTQGQVLATIDDTAFRLAVAQAEGSLRETLAKLGLEKVPPPTFDATRTSLVVKAKAELDDARVNLKRLQGLYDQKIISAQERDTAATRYATSLATYNSAIEEAKALVASASSKEAQLGEAKKHLRDTMIVAPLAGSISERVVSPGEYVKTGDKLFTLVQDDPLKLRGMIPERFAPDVQTGQRVELRVDAFPGRVFQGALARINPSAEITSRSFLIEGLIDNPERLLKPNFFANAAIFTHVDPNAVTVPQQALVTFAGVTKVFVIDNGVVRERVVQPGVRVGTNEVEIVQGVKPGELVAISGLTRLNDGTAVTVNSAPATQETQG
jgi:RND family efflux transporter MFP subunit